MKLGGKKLEVKPPAFTESGIAYHIMMFINREITSKEHKIGENIFWQSMANKKIFRGKTAEELKTFFREKFWGQFENFGISKTTYSILLRNINVSYIHDYSKRKSMLEQIIADSSCTIDDISNKSFWGKFFFEYPHLFDPFSAWDRNIKEYQIDLEKMPQLLKRKITPKSSVVFVNEKPPDNIKREENLEATMGIVAKNGFEFRQCSNPSKKKSILENNELGYEKVWPNDKRPEFSISEEESEEASAEENVLPSSTTTPKSYTSELKPIENMEVVEQHVDLTRPMDQVHLDDSLERNDTVVTHKSESDNNLSEDNGGKIDFGIKHSEGSKTSCMEKETSSRSTEERKNDESAKLLKDEANKKVAVNSAMHLLAAKRNTSIVIQYNHASAFFRTLSVMAKAAEAMCEESIIVEDWHNLADMDAYKEFEKLASLSDITNDVELSKIRLAFIRLCISFGRLLQFESQLLKKNQRAAQKTQEATKK